MLSKKQTLLYAIIVLALLAVGIVLSLIWFWGLLMLAVIGAAFIFGIPILILMPLLERGNVDKIDFLSKHVIYTEVPKELQHKKYQESVSVYSEGLRLYKWLFDWSEIKCMYYSKQMAVQQLIGNAANRVNNSPLRTYGAPLVVELVKGKTYFINIMDVPSFKAALDQAGKSSLLIEEVVKK